MTSSHMFPGELFWRQLTGMVLVSSSGSAHFTAKGKASLLPRFSRQGLIVPDKVDVFDLALLYELLLEHEAYQDKAHPSPTK